MMSQWKVDRESTEIRRKKLNEYLGDYVLNQRFVCSNEESCRASHAGIFYEGQLHHLGRFYDLSLDRSPLRVVIVGQEYGHPPARVSLAGRYEMIMGSGLTNRFTAGQGYKARNPHMRGTTSVLRLLFGIPLGVDHEAEFLRVGNENCHLFDAFALVNYLLCSAVGPDGRRRGLAGGTMRSNCGPHFRQVLKILGPLVVIVQGKTFWPWVKKAFDEIKVVTKHLHQAKLNSNVVHVASFTHPCARSPYNWGANERTPYLQNVIQPTVESIRKELALRP